MTKIHATALLLVASILIFTASSCDRPECVNSNPIFEQYQPTSSEYQKELAGRILTAEGNTLRYWIKDLESKPQGDILWVNVQGNDLCAVAPLSVKDWTGLEEVKAKKGLSYSGAELKDVKLEVKQEGELVSFVLLSCGKVID